jgi:CHC2 zinc finger
MRIDYGELKYRIRLVTLLESIGWISTEGRGEQLRGSCPLPACRSKLARASDAQKRSFSVHAGKNVFQCFGCRSRGNVLDFWQVYQGKSLRESAIELVQYSETSNHTCATGQPLRSQHSSSHPAKMADS